MFGRLLERTDGFFEEPTVWASILTSAVVGSVVTLLIVWKLSTLNSLDETMLANLVAMLVCVWAGGLVLFTLFLNAFNAPQGGQIACHTGGLAFLLALVLLHGLIFGTWLGAAIGCIAALMVGRSGFAALQAVADRLA